MSIRSTIKYARHRFTRRASDPQYLVKNVLNRQFYAEKPDEKCLTDITEFKYYVDSSVYKPYLSAILDLYDRRIVSFRAFHDKLASAGMTRSMSRVGKCIDNGPMEGFWGILKRERYYGRRFTSREQICKMIREYIAYYNFSRLQRRMGVHTPMEVYAQSRAARQMSALYASPLYLLPFFVTFF